MELWGQKVDGWQKFAIPVLPLRAGKWDSIWTREISPVIHDNDGTIAKGPAGEITAYYWGRNDNGVMQIGRAVSRDDGYTWPERSDDPILRPSGVAGSWRRSHVYQPTVIRRASDGLLLMMALGLEEIGEDETKSGSLGVFTSSDDGVHWTDHGRQVTLSMFQYEDGSPITEFGVPRVIKRLSGDYLLLLEGQEWGSTRWRIFAATSSTFNGGWVALNGGSPILLPDAGDWENVGVANPQLVELGRNQFVLAYNGRGTNGIGWQVGFAHTTDPSLLPVSWQRLSTNPVVKPSNVPCRWDKDMIETSFLVKGASGSCGKLYFHGYNTTDNPSIQVGLAISNWSRTAMATKFFRVTTPSSVTSDVTTTIQVTFPERVDYILLESVNNDHHILFGWECIPVDGTTWKISATRTAEQTQWIPVFTLVGVQLN